MRHGSGTWLRHHALITTRLMRARIAIVSRALKGGARQYGIVDASDLVQTRPVAGVTEMGVKDRPYGQLFESLENAPEYKG